MSSSGGQGSNSGHSSNSGNSNAKSLHPIYVALDCHQYSRAVKLCLAQPVTNLLAQALLAHAYAKSSSSSSDQKQNKFKSMQVLLRILQQLIIIGGGNSATSGAVSIASAFPELILEIKYSLARRQEQEAASSSSQQQQSAAAAAAGSKGGGGGGGKRGKKKPVVKGNTATAAAAAVAISAPQLDSATTTTSSTVDYPDWDWIDQLDTPPVLGHDWDQGIIASTVAAAASTTSFEMTEQTTTLLGTMSMTLTHLRLYLTAYQVYVWAVQRATLELEQQQQQQQQQQNNKNANATNANANTAVILISLLQQAYALGLTVWLAPRYNNNSSSPLSSSRNTVIAPRLLQQLQGLALQLSRLQQQQQQQQQSILATAWAAQTALWQCELHKNSNRNSNSNSTNASGGISSTSDDAENKRIAFLPRLAESLAKKAMEQQQQQQQQQHYGATDNNNNDNTNMENFILYLKTLEFQQKWPEMLTALQEKCSAAAASLAAATTDASSLTATNTTTTTTTTIDVMTGGRPMLLQEEQARILQEMKRHDEARVILRELLQEQPDRWDYWQRFIACCCNSSGSDDNDNDISDEILVTETEALIAQVTTQNMVDGEDTTTTAQQQHHYYPLRGPYLARVQVLVVRYQRALSSSSSSSTSSTTILTDLIQQIIDYGDRFASRMSCTYDDLSPHLNVALNATNNNNTTDDKNNTTAVIERLLQWLLTLRSTPPSRDDTCNDKERAQQLSSYVFAVKMTYQILAHNNGNKELEKTWMPQWTTLLSVWKDFEVRERSANQAQKESRAADELVLLAVQQLLRADDDNNVNNTTITKDTTKLTLAAAILEAAMLFSPYNAYLRLEAIFVYADLNAVSRSFVLFRQLYIKHIQHESCTYIILPMLRSGGLYQEVIGICQEMLRLQTTAIRDASEFTGRAMEHGTLSKADEFVKFHCNKMNKSLTTLEAKGLLLDCAPTYKHEEKQIELGAIHGLVGGKDDIDRVYPMIAEAHNPYATFSLLSLQGSVADNVQNFADNRDLTLMSHDILLPRTFASSEEILSDSIRRGHHHSLLMRACLCVDATRGPKKGKVVKPTAELTKRCLSLLSCANSAQAFCETDSYQPAGYRKCLQAMLALCRVIVVISAGHVEGVRSNEEVDSVEFRERHAVIYFQIACKYVKEYQDLLSLANGPVAKTSRSLPDCLVPTFALFQMCAKILETFGWGRRKRKTRPCAAALADLSIVLACVTDDMMTCLASLPTNRDSQLTDVGNGVNILDFIDAETISATSGIISQAQQCTRDRIETIVRYIKDVLLSFDVEE